jgi:acyl-CoA synthetase (AMP-forming)/AMP-acid ligase II
MSGLTLTVAGESLGASLRDRAVAAGAAVRHYYGAAELSFVAWGTCADDLRAFPGVEVDVRGGEIWARSRFLADGYDGAPGALRRDGDGFATVGDRGRLEDDRLVVLGRGDDAVTTGGATVLLADVEAALRPVVRGDVAVLGLPHASLGGVVAAVLTDPDDLASAHGAAQALSAEQRPRLWFHRDRLPVGESGKTDRAALAREASADAGARSLRRLVPGDVRSAS